VQRDTFRALRARGPGARALPQGFAVPPIFFKAFLPFGKAADFLSELLPVSANMTASTVRNRTMKMGKRLQKSADALSAPSKAEPCEEVVVGLDGGYVSARSATSRLWLARCSILAETLRALLSFAMEV
jgi:hypothetical protein